MAEYKTVRKNAQDQFVEKRSRFIGYACPVQTEQEALDFITSKKSEHWDASHNVYAYILRDGTMRFSDDGEPQGTAGIPVLDVLRKSGVTDVVTVATRYFGGILLGGGGRSCVFAHRVHRPAGGTDHYHARVPAVVAHLRLRPVRPRCIACSGMRRRDGRHGL